MARTVQAVKDPKVSTDESKRRFRRKPVHVEVRIRDEMGAGEISFDTADISVGGAFLKSELLLELDEMLAIEIPIPGGLPLLLKARVVRAVRTEQPGMGIQFVEVTAVTRDALQKLLG